MPEDNTTQQGQPAPPATDGGGKQNSGGKQGGNPFSSGTAAYQPGGIFYDFQARPIAGANPLQNAAGKLAGGLPTAGQGGVQGAYGALGQAGNMFGGRGNLNDYYQQMVGGAGALGQLPGSSQAAGGVFGNMSTGEINPYLQQMVDVSGRQVTGENLQSDPAIKAASAQFEKFMAPMIKDAAGLAGLGRSDAMTNALASQQAQTLLPLMQEGLAREERGIDRLAGALGQAGQASQAGQLAGAQGLFGLGQQETNQLLSQLGIYGQAGQAQQAGQLAGAQGMAGIGGALAGLGQQEQGMLMNAIGGLSGLGEQFRNIEQEILNAPYDEQQRLWAEALNQVYGPLGMIGSTFGADSANQSRGKK